MSRHAVQDYTVPVVIWAPLHALSHGQAGVVWLTAVALQEQQHVPGKMLDLVGVLVRTAALELAFAKCHGPQALARLLHKGCEAGNLVAGCRPTQADSLDVLHHESEQADGFPVVLVQELYVFFEIHMLCGLCVVKGNVLLHVALTGKCLFGCSFLSLFGCLFGCSCS